MSEAAPFIFDNLILWAYLCTVWNLWEFGMCNSLTNNLQLLNAPPTAAATYDGTWEKDTTREETSFAATGRALGISFLLHAQTSWSAIHYHVLWYLWMPPFSVIVVNRSGKLCARNLAFKRAQDFCDRNSSCKMLFMWTWIKASPHGAFFPCVFTGRTRTT